MILNINDIEIRVVDFFEDKFEHGSMYITDSEINIESFDSFINFYKKHSLEGEYFTTSIDGRDFHGRFGQLIYSKLENRHLLRLVFVESKLDKGDGLRGGFAGRVVSRDSVQYKNLVELTAKQEVILRRIKTLFVEMGVLTEIEIEKLFKVDDSELSETMRKMRSEVSDLNEYLSETENTIEKIRGKRN